MLSMASDDELCKNKVAECIQSLYTSRYVKTDNIPCEIEEGLFLGSIGAAYNRTALKAHNITHILVVGKSLEPAFPNEFTYKKIGVLDSPMENLSYHFEDCFDFIDRAKQAGGSVLVHCFAGMSRSASVVLAYLMKKNHVSLNDALALVAAKRPQIAPNMGFMAQLRKFEESIKAEQESNSQ